MTPYYNHAGIRIFLGNCRDVMPTLEVGSVDLVLTDPPYGTGWARTAAGSQQGEFRGVNEQAEWDHWSLDWLPLAQRIVDGGMFFVPRSRLADALGALPKARLHFWIKTNPRPCGPVVEPVVAWGNIASPGQDMHYYNGDTPHHPCQKPLEVVRWLLGKTTAACILDPFMGSGTTLRAAKDAGCRAIGIEIEERYCEIAARRLEQEVFAWGETANAL